MLSARLDVGIMQRVTPTMHLDTCVKQEARPIMLRTRRNAGIMQRVTLCVHLDTRVIGRLLVGRMCLDMT